MYTHIEPITDQAVEVTGMFTRSCLPAFWLISASSQCMHAGPTDNIYSRVKHPKKHVVESLYSSNLLQIHCKMYKFCWNAWEMKN